MIELRDVTKTYQMGDNSFQALKGVSFTIQEGELVAIMGPSGSGKSTTMNIIGLLDHPTTGQYYLNGREVLEMDSDERADLRNQSIGFVFQSFMLLPRLSALENVMLPLRYRGTSRQSARATALEVLGKVGMHDYHTHKPYELSGGQQQRVAIARALVGKPKVLLADEPTGALDSKTSDEVMSLLIQLNREGGATVVIITHDPEVAEKCPHVVKIYDGKIL